MKIKGLKIDLKKVPFVPALDLIEKEKNKLSPSEAAALATALYISLAPNYNNQKSPWQLNSMEEVLSQRL